jgi:hypothetical protein
MLTPESHQAQPCQRGGSGLPAFPDREDAAISCGFLPVQVLVHDFSRRPVSESRTETSTIIGEPDPARNIFPCLSRVGQIVLCSTSTFSLAFTDSAGAQCRLINVTDLLDKA